jgi:hypothetical protein
LRGNAAPDLLYSSAFLFFLCASSIGAFRAFFEAISALSQIVSRKLSAARSPALKLWLTWHPDSEAQVFRV